MSMNLMSPEMGHIFVADYISLHAYFYSAKWRDELRQLTEVATKWTKDALCVFKVIQGHRIWHQSKAHIRLPVSGFWSQIRLWDMPVSCLTSSPGAILCEYLLLRKIRVNGQKRRHHSLFVRCDIIAACDYN